MEECDELLLDVLSQACMNEYDEIDNQCISSYEDASHYLKKKGILEEVNCRIYNIAIEINSKTTPEKSG